MILCARSTSRSREQSTKRRSRSENMWKVCLFYSQNNKIVWLSNMADTFLEKFTRCAKVCGLLFLDCAYRMLIGWAGKLQSRGYCSIINCYFFWVDHVELVYQVINWNMGNTGCLFQTNLVRRPTSDSCQMKSFILVQIFYITQHVP